MWWIFIILSGPIHQLHRSLSTCIFSSGYKPTTVIIKYLPKWVNSELWQLCGTIHSGHDVCCIVSVIIARIRQECLRSCFRLLFVSESQCKAYTPESAWSPTCLIQNVVFRSASDNYYVAVSRTFSQRPRYIGVIVCVSRLKTNGHVSAPWILGCVYSA